MKLTNFEKITALYLSEGKTPTKRHIELAIKKCKQWNKQRIDKGLKPWE